MEPSHVLMTWAVKLGSDPKKFHSRPEGYPPPMTTSSETVYVTSSRPLRFEYVSLVEFSSAKSYGLEVST